MDEAEAASILAAHASELCLNFALAFGGAGLLPPESVGAIAESLRKIAGLYDSLGNEETAAGYWSAARVIETAAARKVAPEERESASLAARGDAG